jgi:hypothetical protein
MSNNPQNPQNSGFETFEGATRKNDEGVAIGATAPEPAGAAEPTARVQRGRPFRPGQSGNPRGRPKGSRNKLTETLISTIADDFAEHGAAAIARVRAEDPTMYLRIVSTLVPRDLILEHEQRPDVDYAELTDDECNELMRAESRRRLMEIGLETVRQHPNLIAQK